MGIKSVGPFKACIAVILVCLVLILTPSNPSFAETQSKVFMTLSQMRNMSIRVGYETEIPVISFIGPDGTEYIEDKTSKDIMIVEYTEGAVYYYIRNALPGDWTIVYDKLSNKNLYLDSAPYNEPIIIEDFTLESVTEDRADINFEASYYQDDYYEYIVYAALTDKNAMVTGQKELKRGSARANESVSDTVSLSSLTSYDDYHLMLEVYLDSHGIESLDTRVTVDSLTYINPSTSNRMEDFYVEVDLTDQSLLVDWDSWQVRCDEYVLAAFDPEDLDEPSFVTSYESDITRSDFLIDSTKDFIRIELSYVKNGITSEILRKDIQLDTGIELSIATEQHTNSAQAVINYNSPKSVEATVVVNGQSESIMINGNGYFSVPIDEFANDIELSYFPENNVCFIVKSEIYADRTAPILKLYENSSKITVSGTRYTLTGETEPDCTLMINDNIIPLNPDGTFSYELTLVNGLNSFALTSTDPAGNISRYAITVDNSKTVAADSDGGNTPFINRYLPFLITLVLSLVLIASIILFTRMVQKRAGSNRLETILLMLRNISIVLTVTGGLVLVCLLVLRHNASQIINSPEFYNLTLESFEDAYNAMTEYQRLNSLFISFCYASGGGLLLTLLFTTALYFKKRKQPRHNGVICPHCHTPYDTPVRFCRSCGARIDDES